MRDSSRDGQIEWPKIVCLCGSTRFRAAFDEANERETLAGRIVLSVGCFSRFPRDPESGSRVKEDLDVLHKRKIDLCDEVLVLNVDNYIGESTRSEIQYAKSTGKRIRYLVEPSNVCDGVAGLGREQTDSNVMALFYAGRLAEFSHSMASGPANELLSTCSNLLIALATKPEPPNVLITPSRTGYPHAGLEPQKETR